MVTSYDHIADVYDETRHVPTSVLQGFYEIIFKKIKLKQGSIVLDAGIGTGRTISPLLAYPIQLVGVDISRKMLQKLIGKMKQENISEKVCITMGDITNLPFRESSVDLIIAIHLLHLVNRSKTMLEAKRVLKPNGYIVVGNSGVGLSNSVVSKKYEELLAQYTYHTKIWRYLLWKNLVFKIYRIRFLKFFLNRISRCENWKTFLKDNASSIAIKTITWNETLKSSEVFEQLNARLFDYQWAIPIKTHEEIMRKLKAWISEQMGDHFIEEVKRKFQIFFLQL